jgi:adenylate cyclase
MADDQCSEGGQRVEAVHVDRRRLRQALLDSLPGEAPGRLAAIDAAIESSVLPAQEGESRRITLLLADLRGFTSISDRYPAMRIVQMLNRYFERMTRIILDHGGTIDKFMGDAIMVLFGVPVAREDDTAAALACAIAMQRAMDEVNRENEAEGMEYLYMGIGINTGEVIAGHLGSILHREYTVIGDEVNLAARIEAHSLRGQILISENTWRIARDYIETGDINEVRVKGKKQVVRMFELLGTRLPVECRTPVREVRRSQRVEVDLDVKFQLLQGKIVLPEEYTGKVVDLGYGGLRFTCPFEIEPFTDVRILMLLSVLASEPSELHGKIRRVTPYDGGYACQLEFTAVDGSAQQAIKDLVDQAVTLRRY